MKKALKRAFGVCYYYKDGKRIEGVHDRISGDVSGISGDVSGISGDVGGISGDVNGLYGNLDDCELTDEERTKGVDIKDLIEE